ncbi:MAG: aminotransferase class V-fold PLP-dependent enzyme [Parvularculaceae bacterium]
MTSLDEARARDASDPLRHLRGEFDLPEGVIYLDGNSLGAPPRRALDRIAETARVEWRRGLVRSWNEAGWIDLPMSAGVKISRLIGARADETIVCDSVSVNLFKLATALLERSGYDALCIDATEFPTDQYVAEGAARFSGATPKRIENGEIPENAVLIKSLVHYKTAGIADMAASEREARRKNCLLIWDLSHATGLVEIDAKRDGARFAVGCGYKFLNGGPGAPAFVYVAREEAQSLNQPVSGWMGHAAPFEFSSYYAPAQGVYRFASGTPPILSLAALDAALDLFEDIDMRLMEEKARALGDFFLESLDGAPLTALASTPRRGGHVCVRGEDSYAIMQALIAKGVIGDFRAPDLMRFGFSPLYTTFEDAFRAADMLKRLLASGDWRAAQFRERRKVT